MIYKYVGINAVNQMLLTKKGACPKASKSLQTWTCKSGIEPKNVETGAALFGKRGGPKLTQGKLNMCARESQRDDNRLVAMIGRLVAD